MALKSDPWSYPSLGAVFEGSNPKEWYLAKQSDGPRASPRPYTESAWWRLCEMRRKGPFGAVPKWAGGDGEALDQPEFWKCPETREEAKAREEEKGGSARRRQGAVRTQDST